MCCRLDLPSLASSLRRGILAFGWLLLLLLVLNSPAAQAAAAPDRFERISPAEAGYDAARLQALADFLAQAGSQSMILLHEGRVFFEWGDVRKPLLLHSMRKAVLNALVGQCVARGRLPLEATLAELGIDDNAPALTAEERRATVLQLLQSRSGIYHPAAAESAAMQAAKPPRGSHAPGTHWHYNNWDFNAAAAVLERACGPVFEAFDRDIAKPLGMLDWQARIGRWSEGDPEPDAAWLARLDGFVQQEPSRSRFPAQHFRLSAHDLALYGQLYLQGGAWRGQQLLPRDWIEQSTQPVSVVQPQWGLAYGRLWDVLLPARPEDPPAFFHTGVDVHMLGVYPLQRLVMVHRVDTEAGRSRFKPRDLVQVIRLMHAARRASPPSPSPAPATSP
jgi:CubicO group peptidase (beta-lactamase class C family)